MTLWSRSCGHCCPLEMKKPWLEGISDVPPPCPGHLVSESGLWAFPWCVLPRRTFVRIKWDTAHQRVGSVPGTSSRFNKMWSVLNDNEGWYHHRPENILGRGQHDSRGPDGHPVAAFLSPPPDSRGYGGTGKREGTSGQAAAVGSPVYFTACPSLCLCEWECQRRCWSWAALQLILSHMTSWGPGLCHRGRWAEWGPPTPTCVRH